MKFPVFPYVLNCRGKVLDLRRPVIMGILNVTPDSFYDGGKYTQVDQALVRAEQMLQEGAQILDIGGESTRPGATPISADEEMRRILPVLEKIAQYFPEAILSVDTYKPEVAEKALEAGAHIINDISGGRYDPKIWDIARRYQTPYILMHFRGTPPVMDLQAEYTDVVQTVYEELCVQLQKVRKAGVTDIIIDPGFGFGKAPHYNYELLAGLHVFHTLGCPVLVGISRKSMFWRRLQKTPQDVLPATCAGHLYALQKGAHIFRVHDVEAMRQVLAIWEWLQEAEQIFGEKWEPFPEVISAESRNIGGGSASRRS